MIPPQPDLTNANMGGTLVPGGATFRIWAPRAKSVYVSGNFNGWKQDASCLLDRIGGWHWSEAFNSDVCDNWVNPTTAGNGGGVEASGTPMHGLRFSAGITIPANGFVVLA